MSKVRFVTDRQECQRGYELPDGRIAVIVNTKGVFEMRYDTPFNLESGEFAPNNIPPNANPELPDYAPEGYTTLNNLAAQGIGKDVYCYDEHSIVFPYEFHTLTDKDVQSIIDEFKENGFNISPKAIWHNYGAWLGDLKSGYRDDDNGYHLFTPCGCNPLQFHATTLNKNCEWQTTYEW